VDRWLRKKADQNTSDSPVHPRSFDVYSLFREPQLENSVGSVTLPQSESGPEKPVGGKSAAVADRSIPALATALGYATGVAAALCERYREMPADTGGAPDLVPAGPLDPVLHPCEHSTRQAEQDSDMVAFGALLYELMTGSKPPQDVSQFVVPSVPWVGAEGVRTVATRLALGCMAGEPQDMNRILMELRLYGVIARQSGWRPVGSVSKAKPQSHSTVPPPEMMDPARGGPWFPVSADQIELRPPCQGRCPACGGSFIHESRPRTRFEYLLIAAGISPKRCHRCFYRYVVILGMVFTKRTSPPIGASG